MPTKNTEAAGRNTVNDGEFYFHIIYSIIKLFYFFQLVAFSEYLEGHHDLPPLKFQRKRVLDIISI